MDAPRFHIEEIRFSERDVALRLPFRFGAATLTACPQVYVRARIRFENGGTAEGCAAEMMVPKWFDKNPALSNEQNFELLRGALRAARAAYVAEDGAQTSWTHVASNYAALQARAKAKGLQALVASYGPALIDRAVMDALCLRSGTSFATAMRANLCGIDIAGSGLADDLAGFDMPAFLASPSPPPPTPQPSPPPPPGPAGRRARASPRAIPSAWPMPSTTATRCPTHRQTACPPRSPRRGNATVSRISNPSSAATPRTASRVSNALPA